MMSLKQLGNEERIIFLLKFAGELVLNSTIDQKAREAIEAEKIKIKYIKSDFKGRDDASVLQTLDGFEKSNLYEIVPQERKMSKIRKFFYRRPPLKVFPRPLARKPVVHKSVVEQAVINKSFYKSSVKDLSIDSSLSGYQKIEPLLNDQGVQIIECPGPGKNIVVKVRNHMSTTRIILSEDDILNVIDHFSIEAKIPIVGGILKAAVGDLLISAVSSRNIGSRFILNKRSPYELIG